MTDHHVLGARSGAIVSAMQDQHIVVIGDVMLDRFINGEVNRISPEAPIPVLNQTMIRDMPGGAANVARNLAHLGSRVSLIGITGDDDGADQLEKSLADEPAITTKILRDKTRPTTTKTRFTANGQQLLRVDLEESASFSASVLSQLVRHITDALDSANTVILSDYNKGVIERPLLEAVLGHKRRDQFQVLMDPKKSDANLYHGVDILTPNLSEFQTFCRQLGIAPPSADDINGLDTAAKHLLAATDISAMMITLSANGIMISRKDTEPFHAVSIARSVYDVSGAGDTVIASLAAAISADADLIEATYLANIAAGVVVGKTGTATTSPGEILSWVDQHAPYHLDGLVAEATQWKNAGDSIVFTNGCFDCLHPGHLWLLAEARKAGDRLIIGLNSDASTRRLKGSDRPIQSEAERASALAALPQVDAVIIFDTDTPYDLITALNPDILVKGGDYKPEDVVGGDHVMNTGGKVHIIPTRSGFSTTRLNAN
jgi:D-beta-D-heptose 7-phosphate kinase/D-beta-D-heptose 1-phosphate adenosyltransferase